MKNIEGRKERNLKLRNIDNLKMKVATSALSIRLLLSLTSFSYGRNNEGLFGIDKIEQNDESKEKFQDFEKKVEERNNDRKKTSESLEKYILRMENQFKYETKNNNSIIEKINEIKNILNSKYSQNITNDDAFVIMKSAFKLLSKTEKYKGLGNYSNKFSDSFDDSFLNAIGFSQFVNGLNCNRNLKYGGTTTLDMIISDLNSYNNQRNSNIQGNGTSGQILQGQKQREEDRLGESDRERENEVVVEKPSNNSPTVQPNEDLMQGVQLLSNNLSSQKLNGVTYEEVRNTINSIDHEGLRNAVMERFLHNDVIGAQKLLGMELNCDKSKYPNYVASERIGKRELKLISEHGQTRRLMEPGEIIKYFSDREDEYRVDNQDENFTYEVKTIYKKFLSGEINNKGLPYCIISKYDYNMYLFSADHKLVSCQPVLTGADRGNEPNNLDPKANIQTTPGGIYTIRGPFDESLSGKKFRPIYGSGYFTLYPEQGQYIYSRKYTLGLHGYLISRGRRMVSAYGPDHRISNGCVNCDRATFGELINHLKEGSIVYICFDDETNNKDLGYMPEDDIELIEHFGYNPGYAICRDDIQSDAPQFSSDLSPVINSRENLANSIIKKIVRCDLPQKYNISNVVTSPTGKSIGRVLSDNNYESYKKQGKHVYYDAQYLHKCRA